MSCCVCHFIFDVFFDGQEAGDVGELFCGVEGDLSRDHPMRANKKVMVCFVFVEISLLAKGALLGCVFGVWWRNFWGAFIGVIVPFGLCTIESPSSEHLVDQEGLI